MTSIIGIGTDIVEIDRIRKLLKQSKSEFLNGWFTPNEQLELKYDVYQVAENIALKEAVAKALGTGIQDDVSWMDIQISISDSGAFLVRLSDDAAKIARMHFIANWKVSASHCDLLAIANAIAYSDK